MPAPGFFSDVLDGMDWARTHGADVINLSLGGVLTPEQIALFQPTFSAARAAGILIVAAAGNSGDRLMYYPAGLNGVVSVGAVDASDVEADFSTFNRAVDLSAPGVETLSTVPIADDPLGYERFSGDEHGQPARRRRRGPRLGGAARSERRPARGRPPDQRDRPRQARLRRLLRLRPDRCRGRPDGPCALAAADLDPRRDPRARSRSTSRRRSLRSARRRGGSRWPGRPATR